MSGRKRTDVIRNTELKQFYNFLSNSKPVLLLFQEWEIVFGIFQNSDKFGTVNLIGYYAVDGRAQLWQKFAAFDKL